MSQFLDMEASCSDKEEGESEVEWDSDMEKFINNDEESGDEVNYLQLHNGEFLYRIYIFTKT